MDGLVEKLKRQIIEALNLEDVEPEEIDAEAMLFGEGLGLDSIDALELVVMVEKHYRVKITELETGRKALASVKALAAFLRERQAA